MSVKMPMLPHDTRNNISVCRKADGLTLILISCTEQKQEKVMKRIKNKTRCSEERNSPFEKSVESVLMTEENLWWERFVKEVSSKPGWSNSCSACRTLRRMSFCRVPDDHHLSHSSSSCIGSRFDNGLITSWPSWRTRSITPPHLSTSAVTSNLSSSLVGFAHLLRHESANRLPEPTSPTVLFAAPSGPAVWNSLTADIVDSFSHNF